jgi:hypothetical protein
LRHPFWLSAAAGNDDKSGMLSLFGDDADQPGGTWQPNLSGRALDYLRQLGIEDAGTSKDSATLIWLHALAIGLSPLYVEQNGEAVRSDWPRIPLPASAATLGESAALGARAAALLNPHTTMVDVDAAPVDPRLRTSPSSSAPTACRSIPAPVTWPSRRPGESSRHGQSCPARASTTSASGPQPGATA